MNLIKFSDEACYRRRKVNLAELFALYEQNYILFKRLAPDIAQLEGGYLSRTQRNVDLYLNVIEKSKYTTTLKLKYFIRHSHHIDQTPNINIRLYHDARMAEVLLRNNAGKEEILPFNIPSHFSELEKKANINIFLEKWLHYCLGKGHFFGKVSYQQIAEFEEALDFISV